MRIWLVIGCLIVLTACTPTANSFPFAQDDPIYLTHHTTYSIDSSGGFPQGGPPGLVVMADLQGFLAAGVGPYGNSLADLDRLLADHPGTVPILSFWLDNTVFANLCGGQYRDGIDKWIDWLKQVDRPIGLVLGYQVDSPIWNIDSANFKEGFRCFADRVEEENLRQVFFGWHVSSMHATSTSWPDPTVYYPGDEYISFIALTVTRHTEAHFSSEDQDFDRSSISEIHQIAEQRDLPIVILEANPSAAFRTFRGKEDTLWENFYAPLLETIQQKKKIVAVGQSPGGVAEPATLLRFRRAITDSL